MWLSYIITYVAVSILSFVTATFDCPSLFNFYPDVHDCSKFYRCIWGKGASFNCPSETLWSQDLLTCNHAKEVKCDKSPVPQEMKLFEAPDFSVDLASKKSKFDSSASSENNYKDDENEDGSEKEEESEEDDEEEEVKSKHDHSEHDNNSKFSVGKGDENSDHEDEDKSVQYDKRKGSSKISSRGYSNTNYDHSYPPHYSGHDYQKMVSHLPPQPQHYYQHIQPTPFLPPFQQQYQNQPHPQTATYILPPPKFLMHSQNQFSPPEAIPVTMTNNAKSPPWYHNSYLYNKLMQLQPYGGHYFSPYVVNTDGTYDVVKVEMTPQEFDRLKVQQKTSPQLEKPPADDEQWRETDLFRAGYGYKIIYHK